LEGRDGVDGRLGFPRSFVSVFLRSVFTLVGQDLLEDVQRDFHKVHRVIVKNGRDLEDPAVWRSLVASELVTRAVEEILVALLVPFEHYTRRKSWYISFVNRHLAPFEKTPEAGSFEHWEFREQQFSELFIRLTAPLREQLRSVAGVKQFTSNFGSRTLETIRAVLVSIELDNKSLMETQEIEAVDLGV